MTFHSILFENADHQRETAQAPAFFVDLNLDQIIDAVTDGREEYDLKPLFYTPLRDIEAIRYRLEVMRDLQNREIFDFLQSFAQRMRTVREHVALADKLYYKYQKERWFVSVVEEYCDAVRHLRDDLADAEIKSPGLEAFREYLSTYALSSRFNSLLAETADIKEALSTIHYCMAIKDSSVKVRRYASETDYSVDVEQTFQKFQHGAVKNYRVAFPEPVEMNHVEAQVLDCVASLYSDIFLNLDRYCEANANYLDGRIAAFDREIQFYIAYLEHIGKFKQAGLEFCFPVLSDQSKEVCGHGAFDLALAHKLLADQSSVVCNDFRLTDPERTFVVSGPNQGGKTTFARTFGQLHYLAAIGCPVPGREARLFLFDRLFTHFEKEENIHDLRGKLDDDLVRIHAILAAATSNSILILNEIFTSTTASDAACLGTRLLEQVSQLDLLCVCVTFIDELASLNEKTVSLMSMIVPDNPAMRTYKIVRKPADGRAYAIALARKYRLTADFLRERIRP